MAEQLTYVLITPYSLYKSRTGGIIARLLSLSGLELAGAHLMAPSRQFVARYSDLIRRQQSDDSVKKALLDYLAWRVSPPETGMGITNRTMVLLLRGENAVQRLHQIVGPLSRNTTGNSIRGTYADLVGLPGEPNGYFEPAVLVPPDEVMNREHLRLLADHIGPDGGVLEHLTHFAQTPAFQTTLVLLKPENFAKPSARPGNIIDIFARTGLCIVGAKLLQMSLAQGREFYGPLRQFFVERLKGPLAQQISQRIGDSLGFPLAEETCLKMADLVKEQFAETEFNKIVEFMTGVDPGNPQHNDRARGGVKSLALLYRGENAIDKIRACLGATDPKRAAGGTVRSDYGMDLMKNGAHASDSPENAERERKIVGLWDNRQNWEAEEQIREYLATSI